MISNNVMNMGNGVYRAGCSCGYADHDIVFYFEVDKQSGDIELFLETEATCTEYTHEIFFLTNFWNNVKFRIKMSLKILFLGRFSLWHSFIFKNGDHVNCFISALGEAINHLEEKGKINAKIVE